MLMAAGSAKLPSPPQLKLSDRERAQIVMSATQSD
jgi:hypothetical protein